MDYTPVTTGPLDPQEVIRVVSKVLAENFVDENFGIEYYVDQSEDWENEGYEAMIKDELFSHDLLVDGFDEHFNWAVEFDYIDPVLRAVDNVLTELAEGSDAPYNAVHAQIIEELDNLRDQLYLDPTPASNRFVKGAEDGLAEIGVTFEQAKANASVFNVNAFPDQYTVIPLNQLKAQFLNLEDLELDNYQDFVRDYGNYTEEQLDQLDEEPNYVLAKVRETLEKMDESDIADYLTGALGGSYGAGVFITQPYA